MAARGTWTDGQTRRRWPSVGALPGARRLVKHLAANGIPVALATSASRSSCSAKLSSHGDIRTCFSAMVHGDEVTHGKPDPEVFIKAAQQLNVAPEDCLVIEDAVAGIQVRNASTCHTCESRACLPPTPRHRCSTAQAANAPPSGGQATAQRNETVTAAGLVQAACRAGMAVVAVPSTINEGAYAACSCTVLASLLQFDPTAHGLPPFHDHIADTVPLDVIWRLKGPVVKGFGRGSRVRRRPLARSGPVQGSAPTDA